VVDKHAGPPRFGQPRHEYPVNAGHTAVNVNGQVKTSILSHGKLAGWSIKKKFIFWDICIS